MRILWVKAGGIVPADTGGRIRSLHILKELARRHSVTIFTYYAEHLGDQHRALREFADVVAIPIALPRERTSRDYLSYARTLFSSEPCSMQVIGGESGGRLRYFDSADVRRRLGNLTAGGKFDVLICDFIYPAGLIDWTLPCPKILFIHNVEAQLWKRSSGSSSSSQPTSRSRNFSIGGNGAPRAKPSAGMHARPITWSRFPDR